MRLCKRAYDTTNRQGGLPKGHRLAGKMCWIWLVCTPLPSRFGVHVRIGKTNDLVFAIGQYMTARGDVP